MSTCDCITVINKMLDEREPGITLATNIAMIFNPDGKTTVYCTVELGLNRTDGTKKRIKTSIAATYCPFCGKKYVQDKPEEKSASEVQP